MRDLSSCIIETFNYFRIACVEQEKKVRKCFRQIDRIYKPVKKNYEKINYYFSEKLNFGFRGTYIEGNSEKIKHCAAWQCYFCSNYYGRKDKYDCQIENCVGQPGFAYNFNTQILLTFEENIKYKSDIPLVAYIDFETTAPTDKCLDPENQKKRL